MPLDYFLAKTIHLGAHCWTTLLGFAAKGFAILTSNFN